MVVEKEKKELANKQKNRFPHALIPEAFKELPNIDEKDKENTVVRLVAYKPQIDDVSKILRK